MINIAINSILILLAVSQSSTFGRVVPTPSNIKACDSLRQNYQAVSAQLGSQKASTLNDRCTALYEQNTSPANHIPGQS